MEGDSAVQALYSAELEKLKKAGAPVPPELVESIEQTRADYERCLDAKYAAARGHCDALIDPMETREVLTLALEVTLNRPRGIALALETL
jgi:acetyl-CoA carboxylase carboxyltransferase component